jgi:hypothetical protein
MAHLCGENHICFTAHRLTRLPISLADMISLPAMGTVDDCSSFDRRQPLAIPGHRITVWRARQPLNQLSTTQMS